VNRPHPLILEAAHATAYSYQDLEVAALEFGAHFIDEIATVAAAGSIGLEAAARALRHVHPLCEREEPLHFNDQTHWQPLPDPASPEPSPCPLHWTVAECGAVNTASPSPRFRISILDAIDGFSWTGHLERRGDISGWLVVASGPFRSFKLKQLVTLRELGAPLPPDWTGDEEAAIVSISEDLAAGTVSIEAITPPPRWQ
jgi:hypothetical protein